jgi:hypothetical protein
MTMTNDTSTLQQRVDTINCLLPRINRDDTRERLLRERRTLLRQIHDIPTYLQLPLDWQP